MKVKLHLILLMLGMTTLMPGICFARDYRDSIVMNRVWSYHQHINQQLGGVTSNMYMAYTINIKRRNPLLWLIPTMYSIAHGDRQFVGEAYGKLKFQDARHTNFLRQVKSGTIPHHRKPIPALFEQLVPNLYSEMLYEDRLLSPFHRSNRKYYKYRINYADSTAQITFTPRVDNTQLISGKAYVNIATGRIDSLVTKAEFDMLRFTTSLTMDPSSPYGLPKIKNNKAHFAFVGNDIRADFTNVYDCAKTLTDDVNDVESRPMMETLRPIALTGEQDSIYQAHDHERERLAQEETAADTVVKKQSTTAKVKDFFWDVLGDHMINSTRISSDKAYVRISPLFNPLYMSYSSTKGIAYKLRAFGSYKWNDHRYLTAEPSIGYNTRLEQFYYTVPVTMTYNPKRNGMAGIIWGNGNRTSNGALAEKYEQQLGDSVTFPAFRDEYVYAYNNIGIFDWIQLTTGLTFHRRVAITNRYDLKQAGLKYEYRSMAPYFTIHLIPWKKGPVLTANYERSIMNVSGSNLRYERWEFDAAYKHNVKGMKVLNLRAGTGFYTQRNTDYFVDFTNFRDENLPSGWDDDWTGQFQLVDSRWYNESNYYIRGHVSYDSPLLCLSWLPWVGRFVETERLYFSALNIEHTRAYFEVGYGLKCRYFSTGIFASFLNAHYHSFECKFTLELFRRW